MSNWKSYRELSKNDWGKEIDEKNGEGVTREQIMLGCMLRIADNTEVMAKNHNQLITENKDLSSSVKYWKERYSSLEKSNSSLRGQITKLKKKINGKSN